MSLFLRLELLRAVYAVLITSLVLSLAGCGGGGGGGDGSSSASSSTSTAQPIANLDDPTAFERDVPAVADYGYSTSKSKLALTPTSSATAYTDGAWSQPMNWPIIGIHSVLTPDGNVLTYGSDQSGNQGAQLFYDVWNTSTGIHTLLSNKTGTDIFCGAQIVNPANGSVLVAGGDTRGKNGVVNAGVNDTNIFDFKTATLAPAGMPMTFARWYSTLTTLPDGRILVQGGLDGNKQGVNTPEVFTSGQGWKTLTGIKTTYGTSYPRSFVAPSGRIFAFSSNTDLYSIDTTNQGASQIVGHLPSQVRWELPAVMFDRGKILALRDQGGVSVIDINGATPTVTETQSPGNNRYWATTTVLPDGQVLLTGGGGLAPASGNDAGGPNHGYNLALNAAIWNPKTGKWTQGAAAQKAREYHSTALLLPDASVLITGGGAPGPVNQLNAEVYYPPYLFNQDKSGNLAARPSIQDAPDQLVLGKAYHFTSGGALPIQRVTLVKTGSVTHSFNMDQRFLEVPFTATGNGIDLSVQENTNVLTPGYYMLFVIDSAGVPSNAKIVSIAAAQTGTVSPSLSLSDYTEQFSGNNRVGLNGTANVSGNSLLLTSNTANQAGSAFYRSPASVDATTSFSTFFQFRIGGGSGGDGMAFVVQGNNAFALGGSGGALGYQGITKSIAVEIDTYNNAGIDSNDNHIAILRDGTLTHVAQFQPSFSLRDGKSHGMWVDYDSMHQQLRVYLSQDATAKKPAQPALSANLNLASIVGNSMYMGFTAGTGGATDSHSIDNWGFAIGSALADGSSTAVQNKQLFAGQYVQSADKNFQMVMQNDGNLVLYKTSSATALWSSGTAGSGAVRAILQSDGNFVLYNIKGAAVWASNTATSIATAMTMQNDGNFVLTSAQNQVVWATNTASATPGTGGNNTTYYQIKNRWQGTYLFDGGDQLQYGNNASDQAYQWSLEDRGNGYFDFKNRKTGEYMNTERMLDYVESNTRPTGGDSSKWAMEDAGDGYVRLRNGWHTNEYMHIENLKGYAQHTSIHSSWWSAQWQLITVK